MFNFSIWTILRIIYSLIFTVSCSYISNFIQAIESKKSCPLSEGWRITNGLLLSSILMLIGGINIFVPASKLLSSIPIIGSSYVLIFVLAVFILLFIINRLSINIKEKNNSKCNIKGYDTILDFFNNRSTLECIYITVVISILFFYL